jgi:lipid-A-disaccharide synthase
MTKKIYIIAGEQSGDLLGASLMADLNQLESGLAFVGIGGDEMVQQGLSSLFPMQELSVMGLFEVLRHLPRLIKRINQTVADILEKQPDMLVTIDSPDFCLRVAKKIKRRAPHIKIIHYVAPTVWAWRPKRAKKIAKFLDGLMCLFPFEPPYFTKHGLKAEFVGHPLVKKITPVSEEQCQQFYQTYDLNAALPIMCLLPGSRRSELDRLWPEFLTVASRIHETRPDMQFILPTLPHLLPFFGQLPRHITLITDMTDKYTAFQCSDIALHASGTVALELALSGTPMVMAYRVSKLTECIARCLIKTKYFSLVNILAGKSVTPELLQMAASADNIYAHVMGLLQHHDQRQVQMTELHQIHESLAEPQQMAAARAILMILNT